MSFSQNDIKFFIGMIPPQSVEDGTVHLIPSFGNIGVIETNEGLVVFDIALRQFARRNFKTLRKITKKPIKYLIFSHGHFDHCYGFEPFISEIKEKGWEMPEIIAHENVYKRFKKYQMLDDYHRWLNAQQFSSVMGRSNDVIEPDKILKPTVMLDGKEPYLFDFGDIEFEVNHDIGETDDSSWLWVPEKELICSGDLMISSYPNVGNPYKVQRYPKRWAIAMENMMEKEAKYIIPGHGKMIEGKENVREVLEITAEAMHFVHDEVVKRLNEGKWFEQIFHEMLEIYPDKFKNHEYLRPLYGCYRFAIHAVYRLYHGWYDTGNPTDLFPARSHEIAQEFLKISKPEEYFNHAKNLLKQQKFQLALHMLDVIIKAEKNVPEELLLDALKIKQEILEQKVEREPSFIVRNILNNGAKRIKSSIKSQKK
ncbi:MAG: Metallo-beta-lactamase superfamily protein [Promethearchaeota archaeon]|jgi:alkyl sulfatase BDS1-like metallo-beta-lactamase superfamily hydrolase|nr:MAG: Metallo-beta-lactamase superfamily protein [Candidatus Lokiarchaeota archaeon]